MGDDEGRLALDVQNLVAKAIDGRHRLAQSRLDELAPRIEQAVTQVALMRGEDLGFMDLPYDRAIAEQIVHQADELRRWCKNFVVLGIGGSALGNIAVHRALNHPYHNLLPAGHPARAGAPRIFVLDNVDPAWTAALLDLLREELHESAFNVVTKSGSTAETMSQFVFFRDLLRRTAGCDPARQIVVTTDPRPGTSLLRRIAEREGYYALPIPANVGGRFSVLSAVGLLSAAVGGIDIGRMLAGAASMDERCGSTGVPENVAALYAAVQYMAYEKRKPISVMMPYCQALRGLADWFCQLWAESLGKKHDLDGNEVFVGPTPIASVGVTDQHSVMQLYQDGPFDKVVTFIEVEGPDAAALPICRGEAEPELAYLSSHSFQDLFHAELVATRHALRDKSRLNCTVRIPRVDAFALGEMFMFFEYAVAYSGFLHNVNAFDQPGVELGKQYTYGLMGREGYRPPAATPESA